MCRKLVNRASTLSGSPGMPRCIRAEMVLGICTDDHDVHAWEGAKVVRMDRETAERMLLGFVDSGSVLHTL